MENALYTIRKAELDDISVLIEFRAKMFALVWTEGGNLDEMSSFSNSYFRDKINDQEFHAWIAETESGEPVACSALSYYHLTPKPSNIEGRYGYISSMYTEDEHRRKGLARRLLKATLEFAKASGLRYVKLHASEFGRPLYEAEGFKAWNEMSLDLED
ncbi:MAG TPA: hypothetical protein DIU35_14125 [Candidatus Latescibacteria bacterium]|nr:hypothetical protein [Gemmatimonadota bacterium]MBB31957.1 hypothetical protein [Gemmatimonadota bacterium]HCR18612.1 hypothetical protein [Candidatus Latescibacterota bacterium]|tara:strand:+ start:6527 stop:7000 length:474 start_codon:yes stop_codon:yes gene_type:complete